MKYIRIRMGNLYEHRRTYSKCLNREFDQSLAQIEHLNNTILKLQKEDSIDCQNLSLLENVDFKSVLSVTKSTMFDPSAS